MFCILIFTFPLQSHEIQNLQTYTQYKVTVQVFNPEGLGPETTILVMTDEGGEFFTYFQQFKMCCRHQNML
ncbi:GH14308 [Drosophila grimshawi]|uniref:GH14308 n=1 Tax=Drosophila grimshawi TaxID=7222 RepID=B4JYK0_DROGR|nr:GH14308 [Drosophila grimshawi]